MTSSTIIFIASLVFAIMGGVLGWIFGQNGFDEKNKGASLKQSVRIDNIRFLIGGLALSIVADFRKFGIPDDSSNIFPVISYVVSAAGLAFFTVKSIESSIRKSIESYNSKINPIHHIDGESIIREFRFAGKGAADLAIEKAIKLSEDRRERSVAGTERQKLHNAASESLSKCILAITSYLQLPPDIRDSRKRDELIELAMSAALSIVRGYSQEPDKILLASSIFVFVPTVEDKNGALHEVAKFKFDNPLSRKDSRARYRGYLQLRYGARARDGRKLVLPVEHPDANESQVLPGAPEAAFNDEGLSIFDVKPLSGVGESIPKAVKKEMEEFFKEKRFSSICNLRIFSKPLEGDLDTGGVLCIESSEHNLLGQHRAVDGALAALRPVTALLGSLLSGDS